MMGRKVGCKCSFQKDLCLTLIIYAYAFEISGRFMVLKKLTGRHAQKVFI